MKPKVVKAWACSSCHKTYPHNEHGKRFAETCCLCKTCGKNPSAYMGSGTDCSQCHAKKVLKDARKSFEHAEKNLEAAERAARRKGVETKEEREPCPMPAQYSGWCNHCQTKHNEG
jgi:hypothetical protein